MICSMALATVAGCCWCGTISRTAAVQQPARKSRPIPAKEPVLEPRQAVMQPRAKGRLSPDQAGGGSSGFALYRGVWENNYAQYYGIFHAFTTITDSPANPSWTLTVSASGQTISWNGSVDLGFDQGWQSFSGFGASPALFKLPNAPRYDSYFSGTFIVYAVQ